MKKGLVKIVAVVIGCGLALSGWADKVQGRISVEVTKTVAWSEGTNAIIAIDVHSVPEVRVKTPNVLVLGSLCYKHGLTPAIVKRALDTLAQVANVDYDFFLQVSSPNDADLMRPAYSGHLEKGETATGEAGYAKSTRIARGRGLWLSRQKPLDDAGNVRPIWLYGQSVTTEVTTVVSAPKGTNTVHSTLLGNPYAQDVVLNDLVFNGTVDPGDRIKIHVADGLNRDLVYVPGRGWREYVTRVVNGVKQSGYTYQTVIPAGTAFWYDRRGKDDLILKWPLPQTARRDSE